MIELAIATGAAAGLASVPHCAGMCGPLAAFAGGSGARAQLRYQGGRLASYAALGALAGASGGILGDALPARWGSALLSFGLALALALAALRLWGAEGRGARGAGLGLVPLGREKRPATLVERAFARVPRHPFALGVASALLPCGALYAAALAAAGSGTALFGAASMMTFALVSGVGLAAVGAVASRVREMIAGGADARFLSRVLATALLVGAIVLVVRPIVALGDEPAACHDPASSG